MKRILKLISLGLAATLFLAACGRGPVTGQSTGIWEQLVYFFAQVIRFLSLNGNIGIGIILFTLLIRIVLMPLYHMQLKSGQKMQELQPELKALQSKYASKDSETRMRLAEESQALYKQYGVNPYASLLPLLVQAPVLLALYQALTRVSFLTVGHFLWLDLSKPDPYFILPILAAVFTYLSSWLTNKAAKEKSGMLTAMTYLMPLMIFIFALNIASGVSLYWTISNAFQVFQILLLNNPFKVIAERQRLEDEERERAAKLRRAKKKAQKQRR